MRKIRAAPRPRPILTDWCGRLHVRSDNPCEASAPPRRAPTSTRRCSVPRSGSRSSGARTSRGHGARRTACCFTRTSDRARPAYWSGAMSTSSLARCASPARGTTKTNARRPRRRGRRATCRSSRRCSRCSRRCTSGRGEGARAADALRPGGRAQRVEGLPRPPRGRRRHPPRSLRREPDADPDPSPVAPGHRDHLAPLARRQPVRRPAQRRAQAVLDDREVHRRRRETERRLRRPVPSHRV